MSGPRIPDEAYEAGRDAAEDHVASVSDALDCASDVLRDAAPLVVAAELRRWADLLVFKSGLIPDREVVSTAIEQLRARAAELEGGPR